jgi:inner membrane protein
MMGRTHFATGAVAALGAAEVLDLPVAAVPVLAVVGAASAYVPDVDHPGATAAKCLPPFSWGVCWAVRLLSVRLVGVAHRGITHSVAASLLWGVLVAVPFWGWLVPTALLCTAAFGTLGYLAGVLGDVPTKTSLDFLLWPSRVQVRWPYLLRFRTGGTAERWIFRGLVLAGVLLLPAVVS